MPAARTKDPDEMSTARKILLWPLAAFVVVFDVFGTMIMFLVIIGLIALVGWLLASVL
jgi:hypothetical protein